MGFWGIEVKSGKPHPYHSDNVEGKLYVTQATLGLGSSTERCILQCSVGHKSPIFLCSLLPNKNESCSLNLEFKDELVAFSVIGPRSIHLSGYFVSDEGDHLRNEYESDSEEDISNTETEDSSEFDYDDEYDDDFIDDDDNLEMFSPSPVPNSGVVIEEIVDDDKPTNGNNRPKRSKMKNSRPSDHEDRNNSQRQIVIKRENNISVLESEDEDGFPIASSQKSKSAVQESKAEEDLQKDKITKETKKKARADNDDSTGKKRKVKSADQDGQPIRKKKEKLNKKGNKVNTDGMDDDKINDLSEDGIQHEEMKKQDSPVLNEHKRRGPNTDAGSMPGENTSDKKKKKKKNKKNQDNGDDSSKNQTVSPTGDEGKSSMGSQDKQSAVKSLQVRYFPNGMIVEEIAMGKPDGKKASPGCQVSVHYIGKLMKNGNFFDSNVGRAPFKFRLGVGQVIKGWDVGVKGMRIGDKRRLTIPPSMGYGDRGAGGKIPPNSWLVFDVELVNVN